MSGPGPLGQTGRPATEEPTVADDGRPLPGHPEDAPRIGPGGDPATIARRGPGRAMVAVLLVQVALAGALVARDLGPVAAVLRPAPAAPTLDLPVHPGDQVRRYTERPAIREPGGPSGPGSPGVSFPSSGPIPPRLELRPGPQAGGADRQGLRLVGQIASGDGARIPRMLALRRPVPEWIALASPGGSVEDAMQIGRALRAAGLETRVLSGDPCLSACPYILAGGTERRVDPGAQVGVHQHYFGQNAVQPAFMAVEDIQAGQGRVMQYLHEMGIDPLLMQHALVTPPNRIYILLQDELRQFRLSTSPE